MALVDRSVRKEKNQNIQVFVRLRPLNNREKAIRSHGVVEVVNNREVVVRQSYNSSHTKKFTFDRAFGPNAQQMEVYKEVVSPLISEVLAGYNCTVFAYGQTGTGKTHTMVGESTGDDIPWQNDPLAGIIPRALSQLFDELRISNTEYNVRVSYLELYNEELCDLLSSSMDNSKLRIYEDVNRKGSTIVNGLEEITVYNKNEVYDIMARGQERKKVASTLMNSQSSRSHTVFTIVVHIKENSPKGEELVKIGKLNLVDLAGSENISKAGSDNPAKKERARECVNINQSLLTLGRVITALVEKHPHIPYRESKLTRILQESLGGRTKTSIIATISPGHKDLEETMSTLDYANRAKNIQNKPEVNQKLTKQAILKDFAEEIDKLKRELSAAREKNGVYLPTETYEEITIKDEEQRREISALLLKERAMEEDRERMEGVFREMELTRATIERDLASTRARLDRTESILQVTEQQFEEQKHLVEKHVEVKQQVMQQAAEIIAAADLASGDAVSLHDSVERRKTVEQTNQESVAAYRTANGELRDTMLSELQQCTDNYMSARDELQTHIDDSATEISTAHDMTVQDIDSLMAHMKVLAEAVNTLATESGSNINAMSSECVSQMESSSTERHARVSTVLAGITNILAEFVNKVNATSAVKLVRDSTEQWLTGATSRVSSLQQCHSSFSSKARRIECERDAASRRRLAARRDALRSEEAALAASIEQLAKDKQAMEERWDQLQATIEAERDDMRRKLKEMAEMKQTRLEAVRREMEDNTSMLEESGERSKEAVVNVEHFDTQFGEGISAVNAEMEAFSHSVVHIVEHTHRRLVTDLEHTNNDIEKTVQETTTIEATTSQEQLANLRETVQSIVQAATTSLGEARNKTEETTSSTLQQLECVKERSVRLASSASQRHRQQGEALRRASGAVRSAAQALRADIDNQAELEGRYLMQEFRIYDPSGRTPVRREYRYPRQVAALSPHDRILARFRRNRAHEPRRNAPDSPDSDCVIEIDEARSASESDEVSELSEDSGVREQ